MSSYADEAMTLYLGQGALGVLMRSRDWQSHPLGRPSDWPQSLRTALQVMLASPMPSWLCWGPENYLFYNDACCPLIGAAHPEALAQPAPLRIAHLWDQVAPSLAKVSAQGEAARLTIAAPWGADPIAQDTAMTLSPIADGQGRTAAVLCTVTSPLPDQVRGNGVDDLQALQHRLLELTLQERPLKLVLEELMRAVQSFIGMETACSLLLTDADGDKLFHGAAVGLAKDYTDAIDGIAVGPAVGSCGTAAYSRAPVHVADIATDPLWAEFRDLALPQGLRACWSHPIIGAKGKVLGTFAIYRHTPGLPTPQEDDFLDLVARITALVLERYAAQEALNDHQRLLETLNRTGAGVAAELDHTALVQMVTDAGVELTGAQFGAFFYNVNEDSGESYMLYTLSGVARSAFSDFPMPRNTQVFAPTFAGDGIVRSDDILTDPRYGHNAPYSGMPEGHLPVRSYLAVPVISRSGEVMGGLFFGHAEPGRFSAHHEKLMDGLAGQAATALDNAHLYSSAQREIQERKRAEADLLKTKNDLELAQERVELALAAGAIVGTWIWHIPTDRVTADERFARAFGLDLDLSRDGLPIAEVAASIHPEDWDRVNGLIEVAIKEGSTYRAEYRARHADGTYRWVEANGYCEHDADGQPVRFPGVLIDIEQRRRIESDLKRREADLALLLDATADGFYAVDTEGYTTRCNAAFLRMLGFDKEKDVIGKQLHAIIHHSHADGRPYPHEKCPIYQVASNGGMAHVDDEVFYHTDGTSFPVEYWVRPVVWQGELQGAVVNIVDISERKRAEEARQLLMRELDHRVKNLFSITAGMIKMTARHADSVEELSGTLSGRVMALARAHELISSSISAGRSHDAPSQLHKLIEVVMEPHAKGREQALDLAGPSVNVGPTATTSFALILHELATNAAKYGALSVPEGNVQVHWATDGEALSLTWIETGGPEVTGPPQRTGFGSQLARLSATGQLGGTIDHAWNKGGVEIRLTALLDRLSQ
ncbi:MULTISPECIES: GAF domain-containing protein [unclassified Marinovum]